MTDGIKRIGALSADGVFIYNLGVSKFTYINEPFAKIFSFSHDQLLQNARLLIPLVSTEDIEHLRQSYNELLDTQSIKDAEFRMVHPGGSIKHISCDVFLLEKDIVTGFAKDITKEKEHENYIMNYGAKKDTLLDMMTHNLSGPLHLTQNIIRWMQDTYKGTDSGKIDQQLRLIQSNTQECVDIVNDFLREEHMESERVYVRKTRFDLLERIVSTMEKIVATNKNKKFRLVTELKNLNISTDSVKFFQVIHNLISNAIKFTHEGGAVDIIVEETPTTFIVRVKDDGIGIPKTMHGDLFAKNAAKRREGLGNEKSFGMGLHIVQTLVALMDGTVSFESDENKGSVFSIELPKE